MGCCGAGKAGIQTGKNGNLIGWLLLTIAGVSLALSFFVAESFAWVPLIVCGIPLVNGVHETHQNQHHHLDDDQCGRDHLFDTRCTWSGERRSRPQPRLGARRS